MSGAVGSERRERDEIKIVSNRIKSGTRRFYKYIFTTLLFSQYSSVKISIERDLSRKEKEETIQTSLLCGRGEGYSFDQLQSSTKFREVSRAVPSCLSSTY